MHARFNQLRHYTANYLGIFPNFRLAGDRQVAFLLAMLLERLDWAI